MTRQKAFIFDFDGVIVNSEDLWREREPMLMYSILPKEIAKRILSQTYGISVKQIYKLVVNEGYEGSLHDFELLYDNIGKQLYQDSVITPYITNLFNFLVSQHYKIGIVSASAKSWIEIVMHRLSFSTFSHILSLADYPTIKHKPSPFGYLEMMKELAVTSDNTIILEDSNTGIQSAKKSGAYVICLKEYSPRDYVHKGADIYVDTIKNLLAMMEIISL